MIKNFRDKAAEELFLRRRTAPRLRPFERAARRKLEMLDAAGRLEDLRSPPGNRLEKLAGDRAGQWTIRINDQWRLCFEWRHGDAYGIEIVDYHH